MRRSRNRRKGADTLTSTGSLLAIVVPLALGAAISPTLFALEVLVLSGRRHPVARAWALAGGAAATLIAFSVLGLTLLKNLHSGRHNRSPADASIDLVAGALLTLLAARALRPGKTAAESARCGPLPSPPWARAHALSRGASAGVTVATSSSRKPPDWCCHSRA
jgi:Sap, sulfolipid-1-addressing protein